MRVFCSANQPDKGLQRPGSPGHVMERYLGLSVNSSRSRILGLFGVVVLASLLAQMLPYRPAYAGNGNSDEIVAFNTKSHKYHCLECTWAKRCTVNCVNIPKSEAIRRGGVTCKVCGGSCRKAEQAA